jgi:DNA-binding MarR family transcriptional regulator
MQGADQFTATLNEWVAVFMRHSMRNIIHYARENSFSMSQLNTLFHIHRKGGCSVTDVAEMLGVSNAAASQMLERMVQQELILRSEHPVDRRTKQLLLTEKGVQTVQEGIQARQGWLDDLVHLLSAPEKEQMVAVLKVLIDKTRQLENPDNQED